MHKRRIIIALMATCLVAPVVSRAQEELPTPDAPRPAPRRVPADPRSEMRAERRERLLNLGGTGA